MVEITVSGGGELEGSEADIVESLVVDAERLIGILNQLVDREGGVVRLNDGIRNLLVQVGELRIVTDEKKPWEGQG